MANKSISITISFNSKEEYDLYKAAQVGAGVTGDMSPELKATVKKLYKEQTNRDLPEDGEYYIDPNYSDVQLKNIFAVNKDFKKNIG